MATSIHTVGLLQNLVVHDGRGKIRCGGGRSSPGGS
jgi:hypothetical protein